MDKAGGIKLISEEIREILNIEVAVLMGANLAHEVADDKFCEATIGIFKIFYSNFNFFRLSEKGRKRRYVVQVIQYREFPY